MWSIGRGRLVGMTRRTYESHRPRRPEIEQYVQEAQITVQDPDVVAEAQAMTTTLPRQIGWDAINRVNVDIGDRLCEEGISIIYDEDGDTLLITIGEPRSAIAKQLVDCIYLRVDPVTLKYVGCDIVGLVSDLFANNRVIHKLFQETLEGLRRSNWQAEFRGVEARKVLPFFDLAFVR